MALPSRPTFQVLQANVNRRAQQGSCFDCGQPNHHWGNSACHVQQLRFAYDHLFVEYRRLQMDNARLLHQMAGLEEQLYFANQVAYEQILPYNNAAAQGFTSLVPQMGSFQGSSPLTPSFQGNAPLGLVPNDPVYCLRTNCYCQYHHQARVSPHFRRSSAIQVTIVAPDSPSEQTPASATAAAAAAAIKGKGTEEKDGKEEIEEGKIKQEPPSSA